MLGEEGCFHLISSSEVWSEAPGFPGGASIKDSTYQCRRQGLIPVLGRSPGGGHGNPLQYSCPESPMDRGAWQATAHGVTRTRSWLKQLSTHAHSEVPGFPRWCSGKESACQCKRCEETQLQSLGRENPLEEEMTTSVLAWEIPRTEEPGGL